jgi:alpha-tubulin suppressor-like RCC1 family protein
MRSLRLFPIILALGLFAPTAANAAALDVSPGANFTCVLVSDGTVRCFGDNFYGSLGIPDGVATNAEHVTPVIVPLPKAAIKLTAGGTHACALLVDRTVYCWGANASGQTGSPEGAGYFGGIGPTDIQGHHSTPALASFAAGVEDIATGYSHTCAVLANGPVACVGANNYGQAGSTVDNGDHGSGLFSGPPPHVTPLATTTPWNASAVTGGGEQSCMILKDAQTKCFGRNYYGQLGHAFSVGTNNPEPTPTTVNFGSGVTASQVAMGSEAACAVVTGGVAKCWGDNRYGKLGNSSQSEEYAAHTDPAVVPLTAAAKNIDIDYWHACAALVNGEVYCWGNNQSGALGNDVDLGLQKTHYTPTSVAIAGPAKKVATGGDHSCALLESGVVQCWGNSTYGQAGTGNSSNSSPTTIGGLDPIIKPPPVPPLAKKSVSFRKPILKRRVKGSRLVITGTITPKSTGVVAAECNGRVALSLKVKKKRIAAKKFSLKFSKGKCSAKVSWKIAKRHKGKKSKLTLSLISSASLTAKSSTYSLKL